jgi:hypothetical protein
MGSSRRLHASETIEMADTLPQQIKKEKRERKANEKNRNIGGSAHGNAGGKCNGCPVGENT